jgi:Cu(I)/Ag(I) efflux system protein CusF
LNTQFIKVRRPLQFLLIAGAATFLSCQKQPPIRQEHPSASATPLAGSPTPLTGPLGFPSPVMNKPYPGTGVVDLINKKEGWIEITHEEIKDLMPAMQMEFWVKDRALLDKVKVGDRVDFTIVETERGEFLTEIKRAAKTSP